MNIGYRERDPIKEQKDKWYQETGDGESTDDRSLWLFGSLHDEGSLTR
jgi:hypothetical protein